MTARRARVWLGASVLWVPLAFLLDGVTVLLLPLRLNADATTLGLVSLVGLGFAAGLQPFAGRLSDRLRHRLDRRAFVAAAALPAILSLWLLVGTSGVVAAIVAYVLLQTAASALQAGQQTLIPEHVEPNEQGRASGLKAAFDVGGSFAAFLVLGAVLAAGALVPAAGVITIVLVVGVVLALLLLPSGRVSAVPVGRQEPIPPGFAPLVFARFLFLFATYAVGRFLVLLVAERLGLDASRAADEAGGILALLSLTTAAAALAIGYIADRRPRRELMIVGALVAASGIAVLAPAAGLGGLLAGGLLMSVGTAFFVTANWAATTTLIPPSESGRLMGLANLGTGLAAAAAGALGPLIDAAGFGSALLVAAVISALAALPIVRSTGGRAIPLENPA